MTFKSRVLLASVLLVWAPLLVLALVTRTEMSKRLTEEHRRRVQTLIAVMEADIQDETRRIQTHLSDLRRGIENDNRFRLQATAGASDRTYLLDYAENVMKLTGLSMLQIQDAAGRILSSGHFRNEYDRVDSSLPHRLGAVPEGAALVQARLPEGSLLGLCAIEEFRLGQDTFTLIGGMAIEDRFLSSLSRDSTMTVALVHPEGVISSRPDGVETAAAEGEALFPEDRYLTGLLTIPMVFSDGESDVEHAELIAAYPLSHLDRLRASLDLWLLVVFLASILGTLVLARWASSAISRPIEVLARKTATLDLDRLDTDFSTARKDEIGELSRFLGDMTLRLRTGTRKLKEAERSAAVGELARQVNHDVRNGLIPIRNVFRHLREVSGKDPGKLPEVFEERRKVLETSMAYLEELAGHYSRLYAKAPREFCDVNRIVTRVAAGWEGTRGLVFKKLLSSDLPRIHVAPLALHRILENLIANAVDVMKGSGTVQVTTEATENPEGRVVRFSIEDTGPGISPEDQVHIFDDFYTTKEHGAGLGLSIVRRMVTDMDGTIEVDSSPGSGARFTVTIPATDRRGEAATLREGGGGR